MRALIVAFVAAATLSTSAIAADPAGPADKKDGGSLSSGAKDAMPATKGKAENTTEKERSTGGAGEDGKDVPASADNTNTPDVDGNAK